MFKLVNAFLFLFIFLIFSKSSFAETSIFPICDSNLITSEFKANNKSRLIVAQKSKERLERILNKIPRLKPETEDWVKGELNSGDVQRYGKLTLEDEYYQYVSKRDLIENIAVLSQISRLIQDNINSEIEYFGDYEKSLWKYHAIITNDYNYLKNIVELEKRKIIFSNDEYFKMTHLHVSFCMSYVNDIHSNMLGY